MQNNIFDSPYPFNCLMNNNLNVKASSYMNFVKIDIKTEDKDITYCIDTNNHKLMWVNENNNEGDTNEII